MGKDVDKEFGKALGRELIIIKEAEAFGVLENDGEQRCII